MSVDEKIVRRIAKLARVHLDDAQVPLLMDDMAQILEFVAQLDEVDTQNMGEIFGAFDTDVYRDDAGVLRVALAGDVVASKRADDEVIHEPLTADILANAPARDKMRDDDYFAVPKVIE